MRKIILFVATCCLLQTIYAESIFPSSQFSLIVPSQIKVVPENTVQKRMALKERILLKWYKKKMNRNVSEEKQKKNVKLLGLFSVLASLLGPFTVFLAFTSASPGIFVVAGILFCLTALILGLTSLMKRKKLTDKTGVGRVASLTGIIIGGLFLLGLLSIYAFVNL